MFVLISEGGQFPNISREAVNRQFDVNATSPLLLTQAFFPLLKMAANKQPTTPMSISKAAVVNISSEGGSLHNTGRYSMNDFGTYGYCASKAGLNILTRSLSFDLKEYGILVVGFCPGFVETRMTDKLAEFIKDGPIPDSMRMYKKQTPEESVTLIMATMKRFTDAHKGGYFRKNGEKIEDYDFASATAENSQ